MYSCPGCGHDQVGGAARCRCGADLQVLQQMDAVADVWYNQALAALAAGKAGQALEWFAAACAARPGDLSAHVALAQVWAQLGCWPAAADALDRAAALAPEASEVVTLRAALTESGRCGEFRGAVERSDAEDRIG